jgi:hypothetical protein
MDRYLNAARSGPLYLGVPVLGLNQPEEPYLRFTRIIPIASTVEKFHAFDVPALARKVNRARPIARCNCPRDLNWYRLSISVMNDDPVKSDRRILDANPDCTEGRSVADANHIVVGGSVNVGFSQVLPLARLCLSRRDNGN